MYWVSSGFIYRRVDTCVQKLDPRVKLLISLELFTLAILSASLLEMILALSAPLTLAAGAKILKRMGRTVTFASTFSVLIFLINLFIGLSLLQSIVLALRFVAIITSTSLFFLTTSPDELEYVMRWFRIPQDIIFAFVTAVRFVPVLMMDAIQIMDAQKSRGLELEKGGLLARIRNFIPILVPLIVSAIIRSVDLAEAMEVRGYGVFKRPSSLYMLKLTRTDTLATVSAIILFTASVYLYVFVW